MPRREHTHTLPLPPPFSPSLSFMHILTPDTRVRCRRPVPLHFRGCPRTSGACALTTTLTWRSQMRRRRCCMHATRCPKFRGCKCSQAPHIAWSLRLQSGRPLLTLASRCHVSNFTRPFLSSSPASPCGSPASPSTRSAAAPTPPRSPPRLARARASSHGG